MLPGVLMDGAVMGQIDVDSADRMLGDGTFQGGIVPKLEAAVLATRGGVHAVIGATEVVAMTSLVDARELGAPDVRAGRHHDRPG